MLPLVISKAQEDMALPTGKMQGKPKTGQANHKRESSPKNEANEQEFGFSDRENASKPLAHEVCS